MRYSLQAVLDALMRSPADVPLTKGDDVVRLEEAPAKEPERKNAKKTKRKYADRDDSYDDAGADNLYNER
jgi:hypothetical protein